MDRRDVHTVTSPLHDPRGATAGQRASATPAPVRPTIICMTPVKDEAWILERFLACASTWADEIIIADQGSTDGSREIAARHPKVRLIENRSAQTHEAERQALLIAAARETPGPRFLVALDADEAFTPNLLDSPEWTSALAAAPGTVFKFQWVNLHHDGERCWIPEWEWPWGYMDDGAPHTGFPIHSPRVPVPPGAPVRRMRDIKVLHFAHTDFQRVRSRTRWYQGWEILHGTAQRPAPMYRQYHQFGDTQPLRRVEPQWVEGYRRAGVDITSVHVDGRYRWDGIVLGWLVEHGARPFRRVDMWDVDWRALAPLFGVDPDRVPANPQNAVDRLVLKFLRRTQGRHDRRLIRLVDRALALLGW